MGIQGLTSLIEVNPHLLEDFELRNTNLVIDGNSFFHQIYNSSRIDSRFGGDYSRYEELIIKLLDRFTACDIRPTFVFDGLLDTETLKWETAIQRQKTRLFNAKSVVALNSHAVVFPILAPFVLFDILNRRGIEYYQCAGEADAIAVGLANDRRVPLLSQDSDFFIYDLKFGYIAFDTLEWKDESKNSEPFVRAKLYRLDNLLEHYPELDRRLLPLFAFLCGNDFSNGLNLGKFFDHIHKPRSVDVAGHGEVSSKRRKGQAIRPMRRHCNMIAVLDWLERKTDEEKIMDEALNWIETKRREKIRKAMQRSMDAYRRCELVESHSDGIPGRFDVVSTIKRNISHLNLPRWLIDGYITAEIPAVILQILQGRRIFLQATIEDFTRPSVYDHCRIIRAAVYRILLKNEPPQKRAVMEYSRDCAQFVKRLLTLEMDCQADLLSPDLGDIQNLTADERQRIFFNVFDFNSSELEVIRKFPTPWTVFISSFIFWCRSEATHVTRHQACALLFCCYWQCHRKDDNWEKTDQVFPAMDETMRDITLEFDFTPNLSSKRGGTLALSTLHSFSQWQACFQASIWLNSILMRPFGWTIPIQRIFHGRLMYNLSRYLENSKSEEDAFKHIFQSAVGLAKSFNELWTVVSNYATSVECEEKSGGKKANKKKQKSIAATLSIVESPAASDSEKEDSESSDDGIWGLENRFKTLVSLK